ncbi:HAAS signaling domain-containing protein [Virgibacillus salexigens]|uniref:HAAS signaling domain-containing protein n=1 Tax=Virgibacillus salexigens TaxID=61016 RepID=UPI00190B43FC|nr:hypothetical protein [Virgibacillus salexigens]
MEMIDRYIYAVTQRLSQSQREDISQELRGLITDMLEERMEGLQASENDVEQVLSELGDPKKLAQQYQGTKKYIIGPELYDPFIMVMKVVLISIVAAMSIIFAIQIIINPVNILDYFIDYIVSFVTTIPMAIGWVTFGFVFLEYFQNVDGKDLNLEKDWSPSDLPQLPDPKRQIKRHEPLTSIVFFIILMAMAVFSSNYFGIWAFNNGELSTVVPFLNEATYNGYMLLILLILSLGVIKEIAKLVNGKWTNRLFLFTMFIDVITVIVVMVMVSGPDFWNPLFMQELVQADMLTEGSDNYQTIENIWESTTLLTLLLLIGGLVWNIIASWVKVRKGKES